MQNNLISFNDTKTAFQSQSNEELRSSWWLFKLISFNWLVKISPPFVNFALKARLPVKGLIRNTIFHHFCGGENIKDCQHTISKLAEFNIGTILDYSVEGLETDENFDS